MTMEEWKAVSKLDGKDTSDEDLYNIFKYLDRNGSKTLSFDEFMSMAKGGDKDHDKKEGHDDRHDDKKDWGQSR